MDQPQETNPATDQSAVSLVTSDQRMAMAAEHAAYACQCVEAAQSVGVARVFLLKTNSPQDECDALALVQARLLGRAQSWMECRQAVLECEGIS